VCIVRLCAEDMDTMRTLYTCRNVTLTSPENFDVARDSGIRRGRNVD